MMLRPAQERRTMGAFGNCWLGGNPLRLGCDSMRLVIDNPVRGVG